MNLPYLADVTIASGCSKRPSSKAAASDEARRTLRYVEPLSDARTPLADFFSILLDLRLRECTQLIINVEGRSAEEIFGHPDHLKFRSCMTLFMTATTNNKVFKDALLKYFDGKPDTLTLDLLAHQKS